MAAAVPPSPHLAALPVRRTRRSAGVAVAVALVAAAALAAVANRPHDAGADAVHLAGFHARVLGVKNWYGSYDMGSLGLGWCIDPHVDHPPDPALDYVPDPVAETDDDMRTAMAWAAGRNGGADPASTAAVTLVLHDLLARDYGGAPLVVEALGPGSLSEFGGAEAEVVRRAQEIKADALAHAHLRGPFHLTVDAPAVLPGAAGEITVTLTDARGAGVGGVPLLLAATGATLPGGGLVLTDGAGAVRRPFTAATGTNRFDALAVLPDTTLAAYAPTRGPGQRVVVPRTTRVDGTASFTASPPPGEIEVDKRGDAEIVLPVGGAVFEIRPVASPDTVAATVTTDASGRAGPVALPPGRYRIVEVTPPPGYEVAPPEEAEVRPGERTTVVVLDTARRGSVRVRKEDGVTHDLLAGARFDLRHDADRDGTFERTLLSLTTDGAARVIGDLLPGEYALVETAPPPGYTASTEPIRFSVRPAETTEVTVSNHPRSTIGFAKRPAPADGPDERRAHGADDDLPSFAGAVFVVRGPVPEGDDPDDHPEVGRCTTDAAGRCTLPPRVLVPLQRYCWAEVAAPPGWGRAEPGCVKAPAPGTTEIVPVDEPRPPTTTTTPPTTAPPTTAPPTTAPPTTVPPSTVPPTTVPAAPAPPTTAPPRRTAGGGAPPAGAPELPRTGDDTLPMVLVGLVLTGLGFALSQAAARHRDPRPPTRTATGAPPTGGMV